jgi:TolB-like protein
VQFRVLRFDRFALDLTRGRLRSGEQDIDLQPKSFTVLCYLAENAGRLVPKQELHDAVWPNVVVSDDSLVQCIGELRRKLGDDDRRLIRTVFRRGYLLDVPVSTSDVPSMQASEAPKPRAVVLHSSTFPLPDRPSIAVLPLANLSGDPEQQYFSDGITEDIIAELSLFPELFVIARNSSFQCRGVDARQVGRELGVRYLLEGSVRRSGARLRISMQLIECSTGHHLWVKRFDRELTNVFEVQDEVARDVALTLAVKLGDRVRRRGKCDTTSGLECYDTYLRAREVYWQLTKQSQAEAERLLKRAIELDPNFAPAYALLAGVYLLRFINRWHEKAGQYLGEAYHVAARGVALSPTHPRALNSLASVALWNRHHDQALAVYQQSVDIDANFSRGYIGIGWVLHYAGRSEEAIGPMNWGFRLDPFHPPAYLHWLAQVYFQLNRYEEAVEMLRRRLMKAPQTDMSRVLLASAYGHLGRTSEARDEWREALRINPDYSLEHRRRVLPYKKPADFELMVEGLRKAGLAQ